MACNVVLTTPSKCNPPPVPNFFNSSPVLKLPLRLEMAASAFFTHGYFQQAHVDISQAIITD